MAKKNELNIEAMRMDAETNRLFLQEDLVLQVSRKVFELLCSQKMTRDQLASRVDVPRSTITQWLGGEEAPSLRQVSDLFWALGQEVVIELRPQAVVTPEDRERLERHVDTLDMSVRSRRTLDRVGVTRIGQLVNMTEADLLGKKLAPSSITEIRLRLKECGLRLKGE